MTRTWIMRAIVITTAVVAMAVMAVPASAIVIVGGHTGLFGVTTDQTIRVSILNLAARKGIQPCVGIVDANGALIAELDGRALREGEGTFVDFDAAALGPRDAQRTQLRVEVRYETPVREGDVVLTLEVFDSDTGRTSFIAPWVFTGFNPQPEPPARH